MRYLLAVIGCAGALLLTADAQVRPIYDRGAMGLAQTLQRLQTTASVLHIGAHPDDEDSAFMARAARGDHARVAYLSLNRGEGGQNILGTELFEALGVIRTEELLQARRLDGGEQYFTRVVDFGYSKTRDEAAEKWNERQVLGDVVRVIRLFRPMVIYSQWDGAETDGHGQHQLAGAIARTAFSAAADPGQFPEHLREGLRPWQARKLYGRATEEAPSTIEVQTGIFDPVLGRTYAEIAYEGRSLHRSQKQGSVETRGPLTSGLRLLESRIPITVAEGSIFDGLDVSVPGLATLAGLPDGALRGELAAIDAASRAALREYRPLDPSRIVPLVLEGLEAVRAARRLVRTLDVSPDVRSEADFLLAFKEKEFTRATIQAAGVIVDPLAGQEAVEVGGSFDVDLRVFVPTSSAARVVSTSLKAPPAWTVSPVSGPPPESDDRRPETPAVSARYEVRIPAAAVPTQPYYLHLPRDGNSYRWPAASPHSAPFDPATLVGEVTVDIDGVQLVVSQPVQYRFADPVLGELRRLPAVVPEVTVKLDQPLVVIPLGRSAHTERFVARVTSHTKNVIRGVLRLRVPPGWTVDPPEAEFTLRSEGDRTSAAFSVTAPSGREAGGFDIHAEARVGSSTFTQEMQLISYEHIETHRLYRPARSRVEVLNLQVAAVRVGYVMGSGDDVPAAIRRMGVEVTLIDPDTLASGELSQFDTIVVGIRASETRAGFPSSNRRLLDYVRNGGTLIMQYQQRDYLDLDLPPYPADAERNDRVTDETAPVRILAPAHPVFTFPNRITQEDFAGWVQERNLYAFTSFDERYTPLLESADPGESPQRGGQLYAELGKGRYVYTAYAWFRQLPAGVPGAYRLFANLISLSEAPR